ncbi:MAG: formate dehydrogenase subunit gamma [Gammaproteobacteria bacterium]|nr:MAG: formate dehydrogenase subunit gamma [Gammaproteobacteria bacterium]
MELALKFVSVLMVLLFMSMPLTLSAATDEGIGERAVIVANPGTDLWRQVRQRDMAIEGTSQVKGVDSGILINPQADRWTRFRVSKLVEYGQIVLVGVAALILLFYAVRGKIRIEGGLSGKMVFRFSDYERVLHWVLAIVFIFLAVTGLTLLFGRTLLIPVLGHDIFSVLASSSKEGHNLFGPIFLVSLLLMLFSFVKRNIYARGDMTWLLKGGGMIGKSHASGGFFNMGEKTWYWIVILIGLVISASGLILVSPNFGQGRLIMELSQVVHASTAILLIAVSFGHIYLATAGTEGTKEGMNTGYVDIKWAEAHHDRWAKQCHENGKVISAEDYARLQGKTGPASVTSSSSAGDGARS